MKFLSFLSAGQELWGVATATGAVALASAAQPTLRHAIASGVWLEMGTAALGQPDTHRLEDITFVPVIPNPDKILCIGHNYEAHRIETQREKTGNPSVFLRVAASQTGHLCPIELPPESSELDYEGEIAIVIGKAGRRISEAEAWQHIAGYSAYNDGSLRDWQRHTTQFTPGKNFSHTGGFGPYLVPRGEIADGEELSLTTRLNGAVMQHATTAQMIFPIPTLIAYLSTFTTLVPGDVIVTGTPGGVGARREPQVWMRPGDRVEVEISRIGTLVNTIAREQRG